MSIDIDLQLEAEKIVEREMLKTKKEPNTEYFNKVFSVVSDPNNGDILALIAKVINNNKVYDYTAYLPTSSITVGSVIKGASISVGYKEGVIDIGTKFKDEGIKLAKANGVHMGRPKYKLPDNFEEVVRMFHNKEITNVNAAKMLNMTRGTFLKYSKLYK